MSRERAGNILATGSRSAQLVHLPCRDQCQGQIWDFTPRTMPAWERSKKDSTIGVKRSGTSERCKQWSLTADPTGLSPMPPCAPPQKLLSAPNTVPTGKVGKRQHQTQKTLGLRHGKEPPKVGGGACRRASCRRGHLGTALNAGAVALPLSRRAAPTCAYLCQALTQI